MGLELEDSSRNLLWKTLYETYKKKFEDINNLYTHPGVKGGANEKTVKEIIEPFLPSKFQIGLNKILLDKDGNQSTEQDLVIWNPLVQPRIFLNTDFFLLESILACIEVKSLLNKILLEEYILKVQKFRQLNYFKRVTGDKKWQIHPPLLFLFAYDTTWKKFGIFIKNIEKIIINNNIKPSERFDYIYIMKKGIFIRWDVHYKVQGIIDFNKKYGNIIPFNYRWPQFFPSKLINETPLILHETQVTQRDDYREGFYSNLNIENQILGILEFLKTLCQALEDQRIFHSHGNVSMSYSKSKRGGGGRYSSNPF